MKSMSRSFRIISIINIIALLFFALLCLYPFYYLLIYSFSDPVEAMKGISFTPRSFTLENYVKVFQIDSIPKAALVSVFRTVAGSTTILLCSSFFAYLVSKTRMYFRKIIYRGTIITMYISGGLIPTFLTINAYGLRNTLLVYFVPMLITPYYVVLIKTFVEQLPVSLEESAMIDGAGIFTCWWKIVFPLSKPISATIIVFSMVGQWNAWFDALIYVTNPELYPLQYLLYKYLQEASTLKKIISQLNPDVSISTVTLTPETLRMTITAIVTIPILLIYPFMQRYFVKGIMMGAIKG